MGRLSGMVTGLQRAPVSLIKLLIGAVNLLVCFAAASPTATAQTQYIPVGLFTNDPIPYVSMTQTDTYERRGVRATERICKERTKCET
jgi:hypothetical protein